MTCNFDGIRDGEEHTTMAEGTCESAGYTDKQAGKTYGGYTWSKWTNPRCTPMGYNPVIKAH